MGKQYKTAMGKTVDLETLVARNENTIAVGNVLMNARGDEIDAAGNVVRSLEDRARASYNVHTTVPKDNTQSLTRTPPSKKVEADPVAVDDAATVATQPTVQAVTAEEIAEAAPVEEVAEQIEEKPSRAKRTGGLAAATAKTSATKTPPKVLGQREQKRSGTGVKRV